MTEESGELIPPPRRTVPGKNGGTLTPFEPNNQVRGGWKSAQRAAHALLVAATSDAATALIGMLQSPDERVCAVAAAQILDRVLGKPSDQPQGQDETQAVDISHLSPEQHTELIGYLRGIYRLTGRNLFGKIIEQEGIS